MSILIPARPSSARAASTAHHVSFTAALASGASTRHAGTTSTSARPNSPAPTPAQASSGRETARCEGEEDAATHMTPRGAPASIDTQPTAKPKPTTATTHTTITIRPFSAVPPTSVPTNAQAAAAASAAAAPVPNHPRAARPASAMPASAAHTRAASPPPADVAAAAVPPPAIDRARSRSPTKGAAHHAHGERSRERTTTKQRPASAMVHSMTTTTTTSTTATSSQNAVPPAVAAAAASSSSSSSAALAPAPAHPRAPHHGPIPVRHTRRTSEHVKRLSFSQQPDASHQQQQQQQDQAGRDSTVEGVRAHYEPILQSRLGRLEELRQRCRRQELRLKSMQQWKQKALDQAYSEPNSLDFVLTADGAVESLKVRAKRIILQRTLIRQFVRTARLLKALKTVHRHLRAMVPLLVESPNSVLSQTTRTLLGEVLKEWRREPLPPPSLPPASSSAHKAGGGVGAGVGVGVGATTATSTGTGTTGALTYTSGSHRDSMASLSSFAFSTDSGPLSPHGSSGLSRQQVQADWAYYRQHPHAYTEKLLTNLGDVFPLVARALQENLAAQGRVDLENHAVFGANNTRIHVVAEVRQRIALGRRRIQELRQDVHLLESEVRSVRATYARDVEELEHLARSETTHLRKLNQMYYREVAARLGEPYAVQLSLVQQGQPYNAVIGHPPPGLDGARKDAATADEQQQQQQQQLHPYSSHQSSPAPYQQLFLPAALHGTALPSAPSRNPAFVGAGSHGHHAIQLSHGGGGLAATMMPGGAGHPSRTLRIDKQSTLAAIDTLLASNPAAPSNQTRLAAERAAKAEHRRRQREREEEEEEEATARREQQRRQEEDDYGKQEAEEEQDDATDEEWHPHDVAHGQRRDMFRAEAAADEENASGLSPFFVLTKSKKNSKKKRQQRPRTAPRRTREGEQEDDYDRVADRNDSNHPHAPFSNGEEDDDEAEQEEGEDDAVAEEEDDSSSVADSETFASQRAHFSAGLATHHPSATSTTAAAAGGNGGMVVRDEGDDEDADGRGGVDEADEDGEDGDEGDDAEDGFDRFEQKEEEARGTRAPATSTRHQRPASSPRMRTTLTHHNRSDDGGGSLHPFSSSAAASPPPPVVHAARIHPLHTRALSEIDWSATAPLPDPATAPSQQRRYMSTEERLEAERVAKLHNPFVRFPTPAEAHARTLELQAAEQAAAAARAESEEEDEDEAEAQKRRGGQMETPREWWSRKAVHAPAAPPAAQRPRPKTASAPLPASPVPGLTADQYDLSFQAAVASLLKLGYPPNQALDFAPHLVLAGVVQAKPPKVENIGEPKNVERVAERRKWQRKQPPPPGPPPFVQAPPVSEELAWIGGMPNQAPYVTYEGLHPTAATAARGMRPGSAVMPARLPASHRPPATAVSSHPRPGSAVRARHPSGSQSGHQRPSSAVSSAAKTTALVYGLPTQLAAYGLTSATQKQARPATAAPARPHPPTTVAGSSAGGAAAGPTPPTRPVHVARRSSLTGPPVALQAEASQTAFLLSPQ